ncbi:hypothetical protein P170DRAFT_441118 [Aspergillus steynii IBT 23096]|uniref:Translation initiation factor 3 N-terminal domain-containing protein n=1 Tax=Aspergillus steynii IBT 23096 TaxID=1392250 RepID=A0A2I2FSS4_9EURO|nr:uncharacterized protein P170DRAFT_441118 [Aspergillus steynii IBT 23096]PLB43661.1 hypothetical protein P170DRAFT_441118 [Aspergillus steynii IBT 23096]
MKHMRNLISTTQALRRVFITPLQVPRSQFLRHFAAPTLNQSRLYHASPRSPFIARSSPTSPPPNQDPGDQLRDEAIEADIIQVVNDAGGLNPPARLRDVLRSFNRKENFLLQVSPTLPDRPTVCKIVNRIALRDHERAKAKAAHAAKVSTKQLELNWAINAHDLAHRLKQLTTFLDKGRKVEIILTRKRGKRSPNVEEIKHLMDSVITTVKEANAMQVRPMEGDPGKHVLLVVKKKDT